MILLPSLRLQLRLRLRLRIHFCCCFCFSSSLHLGRLNAKSPHDNHAHTHHKPTTPSDERKRRVTLHGEGPAVGAEGRGVRAMGSTNHEGTLPSRSTVATPQKGRMSTRDTESARSSDACVSRGNPSQRLTLQASHTLLPTHRHKSMHRGQLGSQ